MNLRRTAFIVAITAGISSAVTPAANANDLMESFCTGSLLGARISGNYNAIPSDCYPYLPAEYRPRPRSQRSYQLPANSVDNYVRQQNQRARDIERRNNLNLELLQEPPGVCLACGNH